MFQFTYFSFQRWHFYLGWGKKTGSISLLRVFVRTLPVTKIYLLKYNCRSCLNYSARSRDIVQGLSNIPCIQLTLITRCDSGWTLKGFNPFNGLNPFNGPNDLSTTKPKISGSYDPGIEQLARIAENFWEGLWGLLWNCHPENISTYSHVYLYAGCFLAYLLWAFFLI